jgi:hypothetical protein
LKAQGVSGFVSHASPEDIFDRTERLELRHAVEPLGHDQSSWRPRNGIPSFFILEHAQQPHLRFERHLTDLIEKDGSLVGALDPIPLLGQRTGEGALLVTKQLAVEQRIGERAAVDRDERSTPS